MGQQQCSAPPQEYDDDDIQYFRGSVVSRDQDEISVVSYCRQVGIGKYMKADGNRKVQQLWDKLIRQTGVILSPKLNNITQRSYNQSNLIQDDKKFYIQVQQKYRFVMNQQDLQLLMLFIMDHKGMKHIMRLGVPNPLRWSAWKTIILLKNKELCKPLIFEKMISEQCQDFSLIEKDVLRTLMSHHFFKENSQGYGQQQLMRVLVGISNYMPKLGYCQGMNFLVGLISQIFVGFLLMISGCDESSSYSCMLSLLVDPRYLLYFFYCDGLPLFSFLQYMALKLIEQYFPLLTKHLADTETPESFWLTKILLSVFLYVFKIQDCIRLWDYFLARGTVKGYLELILGVTSLIQDRMMASNNLEISNLFAGSQKSGLQFDVDRAIFKAQTKYRVRKIDISKLAKEYIKTQLPGSFAAVYTQYNDKLLFEQALRPWIDGIQRANL